MSGGGSLWNWEWNGSWLLDFQYTYSRPHYWEADELVNGCQTCGTSFNIFIRRHHCRCCGGIFCSDCTSERTRVTGYELEERVCAICHDNVRSDILFFNRGGKDDRMSRWLLLIGRIAEGKAREGEVISRLYDDGVPSDFRADLWVSLCNVKKYKSLATKYSTLTTPNPQHSEKIHLDVMRTFPENTIVQCETGQQTLTRLLTALMAYYPSIGYAQHSAFVAGLVLIVFGYNREEEAFWVLVHLFEKSKGPLAPGRVDAAVDYVRTALEASHASLAAHLVTHRITLDVFVHRWLSTLFAYDLPLGFTLETWDRILTCGHLFTPALALSLLDHTKEDVEGKDANGIVQFFNHLPSSNFEANSGTQLLIDAFTHWSHIRKR